MPAQSSYKKAVRLSVRLSVCQTRELWQNGRKICSDFYTARKIISFRLVFREEWLVGATPSTWNFQSGRPRWSVITDVRSIFARSDSAVASSKKVPSTLIVSPLYCWGLIQACSNKLGWWWWWWWMSLRWTSYVARKPPRGSKTQNGRFPCKIALRLRKSGTKLLCVKTVSNKVVRHSFAYLSSSTRKFGG